MARHSNNNTSERILDVAEDMFARQGFAATSVTDIADEVGIRGPGVYKHYPNKLAIYEAVIDRLFDPLYEVIDKIDVNSPRDEVQLHVFQLMERQVARPNVSRLVQHATLSGGVTLQLLVDRWYKPFFRFFSDLSANGEDSWLNVTNVMAIHSLVLGYVTLAPLHEKIFGTEPLAPDMLESQLKVLSGLVDSIRR